MNNNSQCNNSKTNTINVNLRNIVLTPLTCSCILNELLKCLVYQKSQIPYPYSWLNTSVRKKRDRSEEKKSNISAQKHFQHASTALDVLEGMMKELKEAYKVCEVEEVQIIFGATTFTPKEIYTIRIAQVAKGHNESHHFSSMQKSQNRILREVFLSETWMTAMETNLPPTNMYLMINKPQSPSSNFFISKESHSPPPNIKNVVININCTSTDDDCCYNIAGVEPLRDDDECISPATNSWHQANVLMKGFKDSFINKVSVSELW